MKKLLVILMAALMAVSCSTVEDATSKWKTPESSDAGVAPGEKSNYLQGDDEAAAALKTQPKKEENKKKKKAAKKS